MSLKEQVINWGAQLEKAISHHDIAEAFAVSPRRASNILHRIRHEADNAWYYQVDVKRQKRPDTGHWITKLTISKRTSAKPQQEFKLEKFLQTRENIKPDRSQNVRYLWPDLVK
ncbi:hypothetical protein C9I98_22125 [Photobacterium sanctipauli]|uniref:Uncharacterized protein n=1 Tax=Photobacterium sanctipauli TaxID=1342794 RepID=A0A2T3NGN3_9GAMM|nr:hypothetical protein [Photobacterium sanctipauli]PSW13925.1 hypothetical protein C9I98_22125 [Photobacterium sanctipauli]